MKAISSSEALDELNNFLQSCTDNEISHTAVGKDEVNAKSIPIDAETVPEEIREIIG